MTTARQILLGALSETAWQAQVLTWAARGGFLAFHDYDARRNRAGFPDLVLVRRGQVIFAELKTESGRPTAEQRQWLDLLATVPGVLAGVWRPRDADQVEALLTSRP